MKQPLEQLRATAPGLSKLVTRPENDASTQLVKSVGNDGLCETSDFAGE
jgi:hypothetical protein